MNQSSPDTRRSPARPTHARALLRAGSARAWKAGGGRQRAASSDARGRFFSQVLFERALDHEHADATRGLLFGAIFGSLVWLTCLAAFLSMRA